MSELPQSLTRAERDFWRHLWRQHKREQRIADLAMTEILYGKPTRKRRTHKGA